MAFTPLKQTKQQAAEIKSLDQAHDAKAANVKAFGRPGDYEHWIKLGENVDDPQTAKLIVDFLEKAPELKLRHGGLYLRAASVIERAQSKVAKAAAKQLEKEAAARAERIEQFREQASKAGRLVCKYARMAGRFTYRCVRLLYRGATQFMQRTDRQQLAVR